MLFSGCYVGSVYSHLCIKMCLVFFLYVKTFLLCLLCCAYLPKGKPARRGGSHSSMFCLLFSIRLSTFIIVKKLPAASIKSLLRSIFTASYFPEKPLLRGFSVYFINLFLHVDNAKKTFYY